MATQLVRSNTLKNLSHVPRHVYSNLMGVGLTALPVYHQDGQILSMQALDGMTKGINSTFPIRASKFTLEVSGVHGDIRRVDISEEKDAVINSKSISDTIRGTVKMVNNSTGEVVSEEHNYPLAKYFLGTDRGTFVIKGNNYSVANQLVLRPGVYVREDDKGDLEAHFNTGTGRSFTLTMEPKTLLFYIQPGGGTSSRQLLFPLLFALGAGQQAQKGMDREMFMANVEASQGKEDKVLKFLFDHMASKELKKRAQNIGDIKEMLPEIFSSSSLDEDTTDITLGHPHSHVTPSALLDAMKKIVAVYKGEEEQDNRDSLAFKKVRRVQDHILARFEKGESSKRLQDKLKMRLDNAKDNSIREVMPPNFFSRVLTDFFQSSDLAFNPTETNPMDNLENMGKVTSLGEGGIQSEHSIPMSSRALDPSHFGMLDLVRTPESSHAGVDLRFGTDVQIKDNGMIFTPIIMKNGEHSQISAKAAIQKVIGFKDEKRGDRYLAVQKGKMVMLPEKDIDFWFAGPNQFFGMLTHQIPFLNSDHPNRLVMAGKAIPQALSLKNREEPLVQTVHPLGKTYAEVAGSFSRISAKEPGTVTKITRDKIYTTGGDYDIPHNVPFNQKGFYDYHPIVQVGDVVKKGTYLEDSNYTRNGRLALGKNLNVAYLPYKGFNFEDGIVISQAAAESMTSLHMYVEKVTLGKDIVTNLSYLRKYYPGKYDRSQLKALDSKGFPVQGAVLHKGDPIYIFFQKRLPSAEDKMLGRLHKTLMKPYSILTQLWEHEEPGEVVEVGYHAGNLRVAIRAESPLVVGDKLTGLHGNKGVVTKILPNEMMPHLEDGTKMDLLLNPAGVTSRVNLGQLLESAAGKIAAKTGRTYLVHNFAEKNNLEKVKRELKENNLSDVDTLINPESGKPFKDKIFTGKQYILKLNKTADAGYSARGEGPSYDRDMQPKRGGTGGAKKIGFMEWLGLLASDSRHNLREMGTSKSERTDYWNHFVEGTALPAPKTTFATKKFLHSMAGSGIFVKENPTNWQAMPLTDKHVLEMSRGEVKNPGMIQARNGEPERGGLFDPVLTGGLSGDRFTHFTLAEPILNPMLENSVKKLLGLTKDQMDRLISGEYYVTKVGGGYQIHDAEGKPVKMVSPSEEEEVEEALVKESAAEQRYYGGEAFQKLLNFNIDKKKEHLKEEYKTGKTKNARSEALTKLHILHGFANSGMTNPASHAVIHYVPVVPPQERPVLDKGDGTLEYADVNQLYRDSILVNQGLKDLREDLPPESLKRERTELYRSVKALQGYGDPISWATKSRGTKGFAKQIAGTNPKSGYFQNRLMSKKQDFSGRLVLSENPNLGIDEAEVPEEFMWTTYKAHLLRNLIKKGYTYAEAEKAIMDKTPAAKQVMAEEAARVPIIVNRNPTLLKSNLIALKAIPSKTDTLNINPLTFKGLAADVDGDQVNIYIPMTHQAVEEAKEKLTPKNNILDFRRGAGGGSLSAPSHEAILGAHYLSTPNEELKPVQFKTKEHVLEALKKGEIEVDTPVTFGG